MRQSASDFSFANAGRSQEQQRPNRTVRALQAGTRAANGTSQGADRFLLRDDALVQLFFNPQQLLGFFFFDRRYGHAGPARYHVLDVLPTDYAGGGFIEVVFFAKGAQVVALLAFFIRVEARLLELVVRDGVFHTMDDDLDPLLHFGQCLRQRGLAQFHARPRFVNQVDGLVRQKTVGNIAIRMRYRKIDGLVCISDGVEFFVAFFYAEENLDGVNFVRRRNFYRLEAALERPVFFNRLAVFSGRGCADALNLAARQGWLQYVGGVQRAFRRSRAYKRVKFVNEDDGILRLHQLFHDGLEALFKLSAILGASDDQRKIKRQNAFVREEGRNLAVRDTLRQTFYDGGLAYSGLADQHRIILGAAAQNLNHALDFAVAADQWIELTIHGRLRQVAGELAQ